MSCTCQSANTQWSPMCVGDVLYRSASFSLLLGPKNLKINTVGTIVVTRIDGTPITTGDLTVSAPTLDPTLLVVTMLFSNGFAGVDYQVAIPILASDGITRVTRADTQSVVAELT